MAAREDSSAAEGRREARGGSARSVGVASGPVTSTLRRSRLFIADHGEKIMRYCGVSVINVLVGQGVLAFCLIVMEFGGVASQIISVMVSAIPAYFLSRQWVWKQDGEVSFRNEVLPFWGMALVGLALAVTCIAAMERVTDQPPVLMATSLGAFGVVWVAKYVILDRVMWRTEPSAAT
ncbi:MAG: hypothetical protein CL416_04850 [Acidimicrobiaceae bacterium]|nr:hypothetical protein [Acidimicrobiaceae bacterium]